MHGDLLVISDKNELRGKWQAFIRHELINAQETESGFVLPSHQIESHLNVKANI